jgi:hypothetical protein
MGSTRDGTYLDGWIDDEELRQMLLGRIQEEWCLAAASGDEPMIHVDVIDGFVTLSGIVGSSAERRRADAMARALGPLGIDNRLTVDTELRRKST